MDPQATLKELITAFQECDYESAHEHASNLRDWINRGGFVPKMDDLDNYDATWFFLTVLDYVKDGTE